MHNCKLCGYSTDRKYNYDRHIINCPKQNDKSNNDNKDLISKYINTNTCVYCDKSFVRKDSLIRHIKGNCKNKHVNKNNNIKIEECNTIESYVQNKQEQSIKKRKSNINNTDILENTIYKQHNMIENLSKILEKAVPIITSNTISKNTVDEKNIDTGSNDRPTQIINHIQNQQNNYYQKKQINNTVNQTFNNNQQNNFYNSIYINDYGKEDLSYITKDMLKQLIQKPNKSLEEFAKMVHFHQDHPENVNVLIFSKRTNEIAVFRDGRWHLKKKDNFLDGFIGDKFDQLYDMVDNHKNHIEDEKIEKFEKYADKFGKLNGKERNYATEDVKNLISSESYYYSGHYHKTKKQIQKELFEKTGKIIPTSNIIKKERNDEDTIGYIEGNPFDIIGDGKNEDDVNKEFESHVCRIKNI